MKWIGISGSWRKTNKEIEEKIRNIVCEIMQRGDGIVSGGALGVDYIALDEALKMTQKLRKLKFSFLQLWKNTQNIIKSTLIWEP